MEEKRKVKAGERTTSVNEKLVLWRKPEITIITIDETKEGKSLSTREAGAAKRPPAS